jgi:hypothetical protein
MYMVKLHRGQSSASKSLQSTRKPLVLGKVNDAQANPFWFKIEKPFEYSPHAG